MKEIEINKNIFESIKHVDDNGWNIGILENYKLFWGTRNGENLKELLIRQKQLLLTVKLIYLIICRCRQNDKNS